MKRGHLDERVLFIKLIRRSSDEEVAPDGRDRLSQKLIAFRHEI